MTEKPKAAILTGFGINSELETAYAFSRAGADSIFLHFSQLEQEPSLLEDFQIFVLSGGWSFADEIQSGRILANKFRFKLFKEFKNFAEEKPVLGICNGFQILIRLGALPGWDDWNQNYVSLIFNEIGKFQNRWVRLRTEKSICPFAQGLESPFLIPIRHGEGRFVVRDQKILERLNENFQVVFRYANEDGMKADKFPANPNGSADAIASITNTTGNIIGLMPHPECHIREFQNPFWTNFRAKERTPLLQKLFSEFLDEKTKKDKTTTEQFFKSIVEYAKRF